MRKLSILGLIVGTLAIAPAFAQETVGEVWIVTETNAAATGNTWLTDATAARGIDFIPAAANTRGEDIIAVTSGQAATQTVQILAADNGQFIAGFSLASFGTGAVPTYRLAASDDGKIFVNGYAGEVTMTDDTGATPVQVVLDAEVTGNSRALDVVGSVAARTAVIYVTGGSSVFIFTNDPADGSTGVNDFVPATPASVATTQAELDYIAGVSATEFYVGDASPGDIQRFTKSAGTWTGDTPLTAYAAFSIQGIAVGGNYIAIAESGGAQDGFGIASPLSLPVNLTPAAGLDGDSDNVYDAGAVNLDGVNQTSDIAFDPVTKTAFGISLGGASVAAENAIVAIRVLPPAAVSDWSMY